MSCDCDDNFLAFVLRVLRAYTASANDFYAISPWMPAFADVRAAIRLLAEQSDGLEVTIAYQTASYRYDQAGALDDWQTLGPTVTTEGDSAPQDLSATITGKFWIRWGIAIRKPSGTDGIGVASVGAQLSFPTDRATLLAGPAVIDAYTSPVGGNWTELMALGGQQAPSERSERSGARSESKERSEPPARRSRATLGFAQRSERNGVGRWKQAPSERSERSGARSESEERSEPPARRSRATLGFASARRRTKMKAGGADRVL